MDHIQNLNIKKGESETQPTTSIILKKELQPSSVSTNLNMAPKVDSLLSRDTQFKFDGDNLEQIEEEGEVDKEVINAKIAKLIYNLSKNSLFVDEYWKTLPINLYTKTIKN